MSSADIIEANESNFDYQVIAYSQNIPVIVDFWAEWCDNCRRMSQVLEREAHRNQGQFRLAKVNVDENLDLARRYQVHTVPAQRVFEGGRVIGQLSGPKSNAQLLQFVNQVVPGPGDLLVDKASSLLEKEDYAGVIETCQQILSETPRHPKASLVMIKAYLHRGEVDRAERLLERFPSSPDYQQAEKIEPLVEALQALEHASEPPESKLEAIYQRALRLIMINNYPAALDGLLDVLREDKAYRKGQVKEVILGIFAVLGEDHGLTREYRPRLANILF